jgi:hypothetical protein
MLLAIDRYNRDKPIDKQIIVASCTTDGLLCALPKPGGNRAQRYYRSVIKDIVQPAVAGEAEFSMSHECLEIKEPVPDVYKILTQAGCGELIPMIESYLPIRQMKNARRELTGGRDDTFLEIKHFADQVAGVKTRGQMGWLNYNGENVFTVQAKFSLKPPVTDIIRSNTVDAWNDDQDLPFNRQTFDAEYRRVMKFLDDEYDRVMNAGGTAKASLECNWILDLIDRINSGEVDCLDYNFYGLKSFNEIIKGGDEHDLTATKRPRRFNADFDWKRKMIAQDGKVIPFTVPHQDIAEMQSYRGQVERSHRWGKIAAPARVIQSRTLAHAKNRSRGGEAAKLVRLFLCGMLADDLNGGVKAGSGGKNDRVYDEIAARVTAVWDSLGFTFETMAPPAKSKKNRVVKKAKVEKIGWSESNVKYIASKLTWEENIVLPTDRLEELLAGLCREFRMDYDGVRRKLFAIEIQDEPDMELVLKVAMAILKAPALGIEPFTELYVGNHLPTKAEMVKVFTPFLTESLLASYEHMPFERGQCPRRDAAKIEQYFIRLGLSRKHAVACAQVLMPVKEDRGDKVKRNPGEAKCLRVFAQALYTIVNPPVPPRIIIQRLRKFGVDVHQVHKRKHSKFERNSIRNTPENIGLIKKLAKAFALDPARFLDAMLVK